MDALGALGAIGWEITDRVGGFGGWDGVSPHGVGIAVGYLAGSWWMLREGRKRGLTEDDMSSVLLRALIGAILGARFFYVLAHFGEFTDNLIDVVKIWEGGISLIGGIFGAIILAYPYMRKARMGFLRTMDSASIGIAFGILFGRVGDLIIGDHLGKPTSWLLSFVYKGGQLSGYNCTTSTGKCFTTLQGGVVQEISPDGVLLHSSSGELLQSGIGVHQTALYDFISTFFLFALLVLLARRRRHEGLLIAVFGLWYGAVRVLTDFLRIDKRFFGLTGSQWASVAVAAICAFALLKWSMRGRVEPEAVGAAAGGADGPAGLPDAAGALEREAEPRVDEEEPPPPPVGTPDDGPERMEDEGGPPPEPAEPEPAEPEAPATEGSAASPEGAPEDVPEAPVPSQAPPAAPPTVTSFTPPPDPTLPR